MSVRSNPSKPVYFVNVPKLFENNALENFSCKFVYNFYTTDERTQENQKIPDIYKKSTISKNDINLTTFSLRVPRYIELSWKTSNIINSIVVKNPELQKNYSKIFTQDNIVNSNFLPYNFESYSALENAVEDINKNVAGQLLTSTGISQATVLENFISGLMKDYKEVPEKPAVQQIRDQIKTAIDSLESFVDKPDALLGYKFYDDKNKKIETSFDSMADRNVKINVQLSNSILGDVFNLTTLPTQTLNQINSYSLKTNTTEDLFIQPVSIGERTNEFPDATNSIQIIGYVIDRYKFEDESYVKDKTFFIDDVKTTTILDVNVKYGGIYCYAIRSIAKIEIPSVLENSDTINKCMYYCAGKPITKTITCEEDVSPPHPVELNFNWEYRTREFYVTWQMPFNAQRDIKQFQIFRRRSIHEPFELLEQQCFDFSDVKQTTGEIIDGNNSAMTKEDASFVKYFKLPTYSYLDKEFKINFETLTASKYIYAIVSIDAHGYISNYSAQYEISFDFYKNRITKKLISVSGAPRPYPNLYLNADLFKDVIQVSGLSSQKLKIYFMPEYFKLKYNSGKIEKMVTTKQDGEQGGYYKLQFINVQNQKSDQLRINIDDPNLLTRVERQ
jgi:hypothetical protein